MDPKEVFNTFHKLKPLSLNSLERIRNWKKKKKSLDFHPECSTNEFLQSLALCCSQWISSKNVSSVLVQEGAFPNLTPTQLKLTPRSLLPPALSGVAEVPGLLFGTGCLDSPTSKRLCPSIRGFLNSKRQTSAPSGQTYVAEQEIPRWSGGILKGWRGMLQNASLAPMETEVCYL